MDHAIDLRAAIDGAWDHFVDTLPADLRPAADRLPRTLGLAPCPGVPWSAVFGSVHVLGLVDLMLDGRDVEPRLRRLGRRAHVLGVVGALCAERLDDACLRADTALSRLVVCLRRARGGALARLLHFVERPVAAAWTDGRIRRALAARRAVFAGEQRATPLAYRTITRDLGAAWSPAVVAVAHAAALPPETCERFAALALEVATALRHRDDAVCWRAAVDGDSWAAALAGRPTRDVAAAVARTGVVASMLAMSRDAWRRATDLAEAVGAGALVRWCDGQAACADDLSRSETDVPGSTAVWHADRTARLRRDQLDAAAPALAAAG